MDSVVACKRTIVEKQIADNPILGDYTSLVGTFADKKQSTTWLTKHVQPSASWLYWERSRDKKPTVSSFTPITFTRQQSTLQSEQLSKII